MSSNIPSVKDLTGKGGFNKMAAFGMGTPMPMSQTLDKWSGGDGPRWLNPSDYFNGKLKGELTGDTSTDMKHGLAKYGLFAAPWAPALYNESKKKGSDIRAQKDQAALAAQNASYFNNATPYNRRVAPIDQNPFGSGYYNDLASLMQNNPMGGLL